MRRGRSVRAHGVKPMDIPDTDHLVLLAGSPDAYRTLSRLVTNAQMRGEKDRPVYTWDDLAVAATNREVHALTGCHQGAVPPSRHRRRPRLPPSLRPRVSVRYSVPVSIWSCGITACRATTVATT